MTVRYGKPPYLECKGRLSNTGAVFKSGPWKGKSIEMLYHGVRIFDAEGTNVSGLSPSMAKGRTEINPESAVQFYRRLWRQYIAQNPDLLAALKAASGIQDAAGVRPSPATELWRIRNASRPAGDSTGTSGSGGGETSSSSNSSSTP